MDAISRAGTVRFPQPGSPPLGLDDEVHPALGEPFAGFQTERMIAPSTAPVAFAVAWSNNDSRVLAGAVLVAIVSVLVIRRRWTRRHSRMAGAVAMLAVAMTFAALAKENPTEQHFTGGAADPLGVIRPTFKMVVVGDFGTGSDQQHQVSFAVRDWISRYGTDVFVSAGDTIYPEGLPEYFEESWSKPYGWLYEDGVDVIAALGNHDYAAGDGGRAVMDLLGMPSPWYRITQGGADVIVLDSNRPNDPEQSGWLEEQLRSAENDWLIVLVHEPPYACSRGGGNADVRRRWVGLFEKYDVDLVLSGHEHNYQRFSSDAGTSYIISGGGGDTLYRLEDECDFDNPTLEGSNDHRYHFLVVEGSAKRIEGRAIGMDGSTLDQFTIRRG